MGPIVDHGFEHLGPSDQMITRTRRRLLRAARALRDGGTLPPGVEDARVYHGARSGYFVSDDQASWQDVYTHRLEAALHPATVPASARSGGKGGTSRTRPRQDLVPPQSATAPPARGQARTSTGRRRCAR
jgi:hypothetical protein